jgi:hypothetical protein
MELLYQVFVDVGMSDLIEPASFFGWLLDNFPWNIFIE